MKIHLFAITTIFFTVLGFSFNQADAQTDVVAFWQFQDYDFRDAVEAQDDADLAGRFSLPPEVNNSSANLEVFLGNAGNLDGNGGGGYTDYTSPVTGMNFVPTRTVKFDDLAGGGPAFDIGGVDQFFVDENDGAGAVLGDPGTFGNDALLYLTLNGTGFENFQLRFDAEGTPFAPIDPDNPDAPPEPTLPDGFDIFYRTSPGGTWFREADQNNIPLIPDPNGASDADNQSLIIDANEDGVEDLYVSLAAALNNASSIEIIINDFDGGDGNGELEIDNLEIVADSINAVPEPSSACLITLALLGLAGRRRR